MNSPRSWLGLLIGLVAGALIASIVASRRTTNDQLPTNGNGPNAPVSLVCYGTIDVEHGCTPLNPLQAGRVAQVLVHENDRITAGTPILRLDETMAKARVDEARSAVDVAATALAEARKAPDQHRLRLTQQQAACEATNHRLEAARFGAAHKRDLLNARLGNANEVAAADKLVVELDAVRRAELAKLEELKLVDPDLPIRRAQAEADAVQARWRQAERALAECTLAAPQAGTIARLVASAGAVVSPQSGQPAVVFVPDEPRIVRAEVEQEFASSMSLGQTVQIRADIGSEWIGTGRVTRLSEWFLPRRAALLDPTRPTSGRTLECMIVLDSNHAPVRIGQRVRVSVLSSDSARAAVP